MRTRSKSLSTARARRLLAEPAMQPQHFGHLRTDPYRRVERSHRLLEDHADAIAANAVASLSSALSPDRPRQSGSSPLR